MTSAASVPAFYTSLGSGHYRPSISVQGAWRPDEQHMAPVSGLITEELIRHEPRESMRIARLSFEILGLIPLQDLHIEVRTLRPGRTIELLEADLTIGGRTIVRARAWRLQLSDTADVEGSELPAMPAPQDCLAYAEGGAEWQGAFIASLEWRTASDGREGRRGVWVRSAAALLEDEPADPMSSFVMLVDAANGSATRMRPTQMMFPNVDLGIHLVRAPDPAWVGLDTAVTFGADGVGLTSTTLNDVAGPVGRAEQILTVRHFPS
ncbi:thioesterase family protein [Allobranchiibius sp. GilTou38]|uniref:thioesterase family protein n=1 Tax=Allobranchiibius sp. GilTou38 TaxID=2815210 RepID=UPI001AA1D1A7|nr:thioesterase family protein [Allobranchiibius sp. GilTou38]MBO1767203.1 thioesterase family protein [Allobranchiibius sp. GilTou38]